MDFFVPALTLAVALTGAVLGVLNTWRNWSLDRVKVRVVPVYSEDMAGSRYISIEVINLSSFPVTVVSIGFTVIGGATHMQIPRPIFTGRETLPVRLESRTSFTVLAPLSTFEKTQLATIDRAYVKTACGNQIQGDSTTLRQIVNAAATAL